ncbi:hypothetical protein M231_08025 [Tremella mesenterica]|uniref:TPX2 C-terminal domain-containing protein n=1 Tax=Tremella mesenterica TaxID=5217 RepID=A0A4Q1BAP4_TREME|nr:hypothetical protein M231_08025 [Tremella mesenterica]
MIPLTPFLPRDLKQDQSFLLSTQPIFDVDESLWDEESSRVTIPELAVQQHAPIASLQLQEGIPSRNTAGDSRKTIDKIFLGGQRYEKGELVEKVENGRQKFGSIKEMEVEWMENDWMEEVLITRGVKDPRHPIDLQPESSRSTTKSHFTKRDLTPEKGDRKRPRYTYLHTKNIGDDLYTRKLIDIDRNSSPSLPSLPVPIRSNSFISRISSNESSSSRRSPILPNTTLDGKDKQEYRISRYSEIPILAYSETGNKGLDRNGREDSGERKNIDDWRYGIMEDVLQEDCDNLDSSSDYSGSSALARFMARRKSPLEPLPSRQTSDPSASKIVSMPKRIRESLEEKKENRRTSMTDIVTGFISSLLGNRSETRPSSPSIPLISDLTSDPTPSRLTDPGVDTFNKPSSLGEQVQQAVSVSKRDEQETSSIASTGTRKPLSNPIRPSTILPGFKVPYIPPLTRPSGAARPTVASQAKTSFSVSSTQHNSKPPSRVGPIVRNNRNPLQSVHTNTNKPPTSSAFTQAALARLPRPQMTMTKPSIKENERASRLEEKKKMFESLSKTLNPKSERVSTLKSDKREMKKTIPVSGKTPGKASRIRAEERARYDEEMKRRRDMREKELEEMERLKGEIENEEWRMRRKETVIWARPVPEMYKKS